MRHLLYVEDEEGDAFLLKHAFQQVGIQDPFQLVSDGDQAIAYLTGHVPYTDRQRYPLPCLILLDLNLPKKNGFEVLDWRRNDPVAKLIPAVVLTSSNSPEDIRRAYGLGAAGYLTKLTSPAEFAIRVCAIRDFWLKHNTPPPPCLENGISGYET